MRPNLPLFLGSAMSSQGQPIISTGQSCILTRLCSCDICGFSCGLINCGVYGRCQLVSTHFTWSFSQRQCWKVWWSKWLRIRRIRGLICRRTRICKSVPLWRNEVGKYLSEFMLQLFWGYKCSKQAGFITLPWQQVLVVRTDLKMSSGKIAAQLVVSNFLICWLTD